MKNRYLLFAILTAAVFALCGCRLAREDAGEESAASDRLVGVFLTMEPLDLFDMDAYMRDNLTTRGGKISFDGDTAAYQGRLYAVLREQTLTNEDTGTTSQIKEFVFEGVDGISYTCATVLAGDGTDAYITSASDTAVSDGHMSVIVGDQEDKLEMTGTVYLTAQEVAVYFNPVYQSPDGRVYAVKGHGLSSGGDLREGTQFSQKLSDCVTTTENGARKQTENTIEIAVSMIYRPYKTVVIQMDADSRVVSRAEYAPGDLPEAIDVDADARFILVETHKSGPDGNPVVSRTLYEPKDESLWAFSLREDGICPKQWAKINWQTP